MLTGITVVPPPGAAWPEFTLPMLVPGDDGLFLSKVDGLGPVANNIVTKDYGIGDGEYFVGSHKGKRNIVMTIGMETRGFDVEAAREELYGFFYTQSSLKLRLNFDNRTAVEIDGYPETNESDRFVQDLESQISIICPKPNFIEVTPRTATGIVTDSPDYATLNYGGNQSVGFLIRILPPAGSTSAINLGRLIYEIGVPSATPDVFLTQRFMDIQGVGAGGYPLMDPEEEFWLDSRQGRKSIYILNPTTGDRRNAMKGMTDGSRWPILHPAPNQFRIFNDGNEEYQWDVYYHYEFGGV